MENLGLLGLIGVVLRTIQEVGQMVSRANRWMLEKLEAQRERYRQEVLSKLSEEEREIIIRELQNGHTDVGDWHGDYTRLCKLNVNTL